MPILIAIPILIGLIIYAAIRLYAYVAQQFGWLAGLAAVILAAAVVVLVIVVCIWKYQRIHGRTVRGERILAMTGSWGSLSLDANQKRGRLALDGYDISFIFADIRQAMIDRDGARPVLLVQLDHAPQSDWRIPMDNANQARRWQKIVRFAAEQKL